MISTIEDTSIQLGLVNVTKESDMMWLNYSITVWMKLKEWKWTSILTAMNKKKEPSSWNGLPWRWLIWLTSGKSLWEQLFQSYIHIIFGRKKDHLKLVEDGPLRDVSGSIEQYQMFDDRRIQTNINYVEKTLKHWCI